MAVNWPVISYKHTSVVFEMRIMVQFHLVKIIGSLIAVCHMCYAYHHLGRSYNMNVVLVIYAYKSK